MTPTAEGKLTTTSYFDGGLPLSDLRGEPAKKEIL